MTAAARVVAYTRVEKETRFERRRRGRVPGRRIRGLPCPGGPLCGSCGIPARRVFVGTPEAWERRWRCDQCGRDLGHRYEEDELGEFGLARLNAWVHAPLQPRADEPASEWGASIIRRALASPDPRKAPTRRSSP